MDFTRYAPADGTLTAIRTAIIRINDDMTRHISTEAEAKTARDALLIDGDRKALDAAEATLRTARDDAERLEAVADQLARRLEVAERDDALGAVRTALENEAAANEQANTFWRKNGSKLRGMLDEASKIVAIRGTAALRVKQARNVAIERFPELGDEIAKGHDGATLDVVVYDEWRETLGRGNPTL